jgi:hypothetical protein
LPLLAFVGTLVHCRLGGRRAGDPLVIASQPRRLPEVVIDQARTPTLQRVEVQCGRKAPEQFELFVRRHVGQLAD